jgi:HSP20 family protein
MGENSLDRFFCVLITREKTFLKEDTMTLARFYPSNWLRQEDGDKTLTVRQQQASPRDAFHSGIDRLFDDFFTSFAIGGGPSAFRRGGGVEGLLKPRLDLGADDKEYKVSVELPGVDEDNVSIEVNQNALIISGEKKHETEEKDAKNVYHIERVYGSFQRTVSLPEDADVKGITAHFDKGVLSIVIPRTEIREAKKIPISKK